MPDDIKNEPEAENTGTRFLVSFVTGLACISLLLAYSYLTFEFSIPSEFSLILGAVITAIFWKHRKTRGMLNGLFTCGVVMTGVSLFVYLLNWFVN